MAIKNLLCTKIIDLQFERSNQHANSEAIEIEERKIAGLDCLVEVLTNKNGKLTDMIVAADVAANFDDYINLNHEYDRTIPCRSNVLTSQNFAIKCAVNAFVEESKRKYPRFYSELERKGNKQMRAR